MAFRAAVGVAVLATAVLAACAPGQDEPREGEARGLHQEVAPVGEELAGHLRRLASRAPTVVVGRVAEIRPGRVAGPDRLQFQDVRLTTEEVLKGDPGTSDVVVEQVSSEGRVVLDFEPFQVDGRYLVFLRSSGTEPGRQVILPGGRFELVEDRVRAMDPEPVAEGTVWSEEAVLEVVRAATDSSPARR